MTHEAMTHEVMTHEVMTHEVVTHEVVTYEVVTHEAVTHEAMTHEAMTHEAMTHEAHCWLYCVLCFQSRNNVVAAGAAAYDESDGRLPAYQVLTSGMSLVNTSKAPTSFQIRYDAMGANCVHATPVFRTVNVIDPCPPPEHTCPASLACSVLGACVLPLGGGGGGVREHLRPPLCRIPLPQPSPCMVPGSWTGPGAS